MNVSSIDRVVMELSQALEYADVPQADSFVTQKVKRVSEILRGDPALFEEPEVIEYIEKFQKSNISPEIKEMIMIANSMFNTRPFKRQMTSESGIGPTVESISRTGCSFGDKNGILTISDADLIELSNDHAKTDVFWNSISSPDTQALVIEFNNKKMQVYEKFLLDQLIEKRPNITDLTELWTLQFSSGDECEVPTAKLQMCFDFFEAIRCSEDKVALQSVSSESFATVLQEVETGIFNPPNDQDGYDIAVDFLGFYSTSMLPENVIGQEKLEKHLGNIGQVARPTKELLEALEATCPFSNDVNIKTRDSHVVTWVPKKVGKHRLSPNRIEALINSDKSGANRIGFDRDWSHIPQEIADQETEGGYWLIMFKNALEATKEMTFDAAEAYIKNNYKNYEVPSTVEAILCSLLNYVCSGEKKERILARENPLRHTWCKETVRMGIHNWHTIVGALDPTGLDVDYYHTTSIGIGVCPVRKFLAH